jgi:hypothetical protein
MGHATMLLAVFAVVGTAWPNTYQVTNARDSGVGSLRWAINQANSHTGRDKIVLAASMTGKVILPTSELPAIADSQTIILGDTDGDGKPNVAVNGKKLSATGSGIWIKNANRCTVSGLAVCGFPQRGIYLRNADNCKIYACHVGVNLAGTKVVGNPWGDISLWETDDSLIGGTTSASRNLVGCASVGIMVEDGNRNHIAGNYFGLAHDGQTALGGAGSAIRLSGSGPDTCTDNLIGGHTPGERNVIGAVHSALTISQGDSNTFCGNYVGLAADGLSRRALQVRAVSIGAGSTGNTVGGSSLAARNVFGAGPGGVDFTGAGTKNNKVRGNVFGTNATGSRQFDCGSGVVMYGGAGPQIIGGSTPEAGNYFTTKWQWAIHKGVWLDGGGSGSVIRNNKFGIRPDGHNALPMDVGVLVVGETCQVLENIFAGAEVGLEVNSSGALARAFANRFRGCDRAVWVHSDARCVLGNVRNPDPGDNGGNTFRPSNTWTIYNDTPHLIKAEGNWFETTLRSEINAKIWDRRDDPGLGKVDFIPLRGGIIPTGAPPALTITSAAALPTVAGGAEIAFTLSAPADVMIDVLNIAGRAVATVARDLAAEAGPRRLVWSGQTLTGTRAPAGKYLVRITARSASGYEHTALCGVTLQ